MKTILGGGALIALALLSGCLLFSSGQSFGETLITQLQQQKAESTGTQKQEAGVNSSAAAEVAVSPSSAAPATSAVKASETAKAAAPAVETKELAAAVAAPSASYVATAYSLRGRTASGRVVARGLIAADPRVLPLGSRVRLEAGKYSGEYLVADTGRRVRGKRIDIWTSSSREARHFGRRPVKLTVLSYGQKRPGVKRAIRW